MNTAIRAPAVAGLFYPGGADVCRQTAAALLETVRGEAVPAERPKALVVPHAGWVYSGAVAARAIAQLAPWANDIRRVVLLGPNHRVALRGIAAPASTAFRTPLGDVPVDVELRDRVAALPGTGIDDRPHAQEHALEVQLPLLQCVLPRFSILPLVVGDCPPQLVAAVLQSVWNLPDTAVLISSDLSHYQPYEAARTRDGATAAHIEALEPVLQPDDACGCRALNGLLGFAREQGLRLSRIALINSGDTAGTRDRVVGYGAWRVD